MVLMNVNHRTKVSHPSNKIVKISKANVIEIRDEHLDDGEDALAVNLWLHRFQMPERFARAGQSQYLVTVQSPVACPWHALSSCVYIFALLLLSTDLLSQLKYNK